MSSAADQLLPAVIVAVASTGACLAGGWLALCMLACVLEATTGFLAPAVLRPRAVRLVVAVLVGSAAPALGAVGAQADESLPPLARPVDAPLPPAAQRRHLVVH